MLRCSGFRLRLSSADSRVMELLLLCNESGPGTHATYRDEALAMEASGIIPPLRACFHRTNADGQRIVAHRRDSDSTVTANCKTYGAIWRERRRERLCWQLQQNAWRRASTVIAPLRNLRRYARACRGGVVGFPTSPLAFMPIGRMGPPLRSFAADAHDCIVVPVLGPTAYKVVARFNRARKRAPL